jgi:ubiquinone biosynthesis protein Coq4
MQELNFNNFYSDQINHLTLQEALELHYKLNPQFTHWSKYSSKEAQYLIKNHDISHVIFGCDTSYGGEYQVQTWVKYACKLNIPATSFFKFIFNKDLIQIVLPPQLIKYSLGHLKEFSEYKKQIKNQAGQICKKWQYGDEETQMLKTVGQIRQEYNIVIV